MEQLQPIVTIFYRVYCAYKCSAHLNFTMIFHKKLFLFFKNNFKRNNHRKFFHHKSYLKPFLSYLPCIVHREYFSIIFNVKKCALHSIKYSSKVLTLHKILDQGGSVVQCETLQLITPKCKQTTLLKGFMTFFPRVNVVKLFSLPLVLLTNKLECLNMTSLLGLV